MATKNPVLKRVIISYEVLAPLEDSPESVDIDSIHYQCDQGEWSGRIIGAKVQQLGKTAAINACGKHGTDPEFFNL